MGGAAAREDRGADVGQDTRTAVRERGADFREAGGPLWGRTGGQLGGMTGGKLWEDRGQPEGRNRGQL